MLTRKLSDYTAKLILMLLMSFSLVYPFTTTLSFKYTPYQVAGLNLLFLLLFSILFVNKIMARISVVLISLCSILYVLYSFYTGSIYSLIEPFIWLNNYVLGRAHTQDAFALVFTLLFSIVFSLLVYIFTIKKFNFHIICLSGISIFCSQWILNYFVEKKAYISFYTFIIAIIVYYFLHIYNKKSVQESNDFASPSSFILLAAPICLIVLLITNAVPVNSRPIEWKWLDEKINYAFSGFNNDYSKLSNIGYFSLSSTGFGSDINKLGGDVSLDNTMVLTVNAPKVLYLKGRSSDMYTGSSWVNTNISYLQLHNPKNNMNFDNFELEHGLSLLYDSYNNPNDNLSLAPEDPFLGIVSKDRISVKYENIKTKSLFVPLKSFNFTFSNFDKGDVFVNAEGVLLARKTMSKGLSYSFNTYSIKYHRNDFANYMRMSKRYLYEGYLNYTLDEINRIIYNNIKDVVNNYHRDRGVLIWNASNEEAIRQLVLQAPNTELIKNNLYNYLLNHFAGSLNLSYNEREAFIRAIVEPCIGIIDSHHVYENSQDLFERAISLKSLVENSDTIYSKYLNLPQTLPDRIKRLAVSITKDQLSNYDKVKAIEQYLSNNYTYTLTPGTVPDGRDFADYFLFDHTEGYCTYFATSMAVLVRSIGIPARFVEGYVLPSHPTKSYTYEVTNEQAHAWVEVYFEGIGWIQFEPTSPYEDSLYQTRVYGPGGSDQQENPYARPTNSGYPGNNNNTPQQQTVETGSVNLKFIIITSSVLAVILLFALIVAVNLFGRRRYLARVAKKSPREGIIELYSYYMKHLSYQKADLKAGETPIEHAQRLDNIGKFYPHKMLDITEIFIKARYSRSEVTQSDFDKVYRFYTHVLKAARENLGKVRYLLYMYILRKL